MPRRADILWDENGKEYEKPEETDAERAKRIEEQTRLTMNQCELLAMLIEGMKK